MAKSTSFGSRKLPVGKQYRSGTIGRANKDLDRDIDDAFKTLEADITAGSNSNGFATRVHSGEMTITNPATNATVSVANAADDSIVIIHDNTSAVDAAAVRFTGSVTGEVLTVTTRNAAGVATTPGAAEGDTITLNWWVDGRP